MWYGVYKIAQAQQHGETFGAFTVRCRTSSKKVLTCGLGNIGAMLYFTDMTEFPYTTSAIQEDVAFQVGTH
jgi:hypothetical protein